MPTVVAHGLGGRADLPVPLWMAQYAAVAALVVSFAFLTTYWNRPRLEGQAAGDGRPLPGWLQRFADARATRVGLVPASLLLGPIWRLLNPLRTLSAGLARFSGDPDEQGTRQLPARLGYWPAAVGLAVFAWLELVYLYRDEPFTLLGFLLVYGSVQIVAGLAYGQGWFARGDGFEVYSSLVARLCPISRRPDGRLALRNPLTNLACLQPEPGLVAVVCVLLASTAFHGLSRTRWWNDLIVDADPLANALWGTAGLIAAIGTVAGTYTLATRLTPAGEPGDRLDRRFVHSLVPILIGAIVAGHVVGVISAHDRAVACSPSVTRSPASTCCSPPWSSTPSPASRCWSAHDHHSRPIVLAEPPPRRRTVTSVSAIGAILRHGSGLDELAIFVFPVVVGIGFWLITRRKPDEDQDEDDSSERG
jgi:hypothetical protein